MLEKEMHSDLVRAAAFINSVGLSATREDGATGFVHGVRVFEGALFFDGDCAPSALLHEAGHIACVPGRFRHLMSADLSAGMRQMFAQIDQLDLDPDHPIQRAAIQCSDPEATAWAWAAGLAIGLAPEVIIADAEYDGSGAEMRMMLGAGGYIGINGLAHAGLCRKGRWSPEPGRYPIMIHWVQPF